MMKNVLKFKFEEKEGFLSAVEREGYYYALVQKDTPKVADVLKTKTLLITFLVKTPRLSTLYDWGIVWSRFNRLSVSSVRRRENSLFQGIRWQFMCFKNWKEININQISDLFFCHHFVTSHDYHENIYGGPSDEKDGICHSRYHYKLFNTYGSPSWSVNPIS